MPEDRLAKIQEQLRDLVLQRAVSLNDIDQALGDLRSSIADAPESQADIDATTELPKSTKGDAADQPEETQVFRRQLVGGAGDQNPAAVADYEILEEIARGGMGVVYKARQISLNRIVALKMILAGQLASDDQVQRFRSEAEAAANLDHPGIVPIYEIGQQDGQHFFSMGFVQGQSLADRLSERPFPAREAATLVRKIADAVAYAHSQGLLHRDLKCANVLLDVMGEPRVTDFGLAKRLEGDSNLTATGQIMGTPSYMPPEQALGQAVDERSDVYSLGAILYALLTGRPPHQAANPVDAIRSVIEREPPSPRQLDRSIPRDLETICLKALSKEPGRRYNSAEELSQDLQRSLHMEPIVARRVGRVEKAWLWCKRRPVVAGLLAALFLVMTIASMVSWERNNAQFSKGLVDSLVNADPTRVKNYVDQIEDYRWWTEPLLETRYAAARDDSIEKVYLGLALLRFDDSQIAALKEALLTSDPRRFPVLRDELVPHRDRLLEELWVVFRDESDEKRRFHAGLALANYADDDEQWTAGDAKFLVDSLLNQIPEDQPLYRGFLLDIKERMYPELKRAFLDPAGKERQTLGAAKAFAEYALDDIGRIADVAAEATVEQWEVLYQVLENASPERIHAALRPVVSEQPLEELSPLERVTFGKRRAGAAITLLRKGDREQIFDALRVTDDPESLTQFVHRCRARGVTPAELLECLDAADKLRQGKSGQERQIEDRVLFGILLALGEFPLRELPDSQSLVSRLADWYANDPSSAMHGATGWLLRHWGQDEVAKGVDERPVPYSPDRQWYTLEIKTVMRDAVGLPLEKKSYMTFVVIPAGTYTVGSPEDEPERESDETRQEVTITRSFAVLDREVTWADAELFNPQTANAMRGAVQTARGWSLGLNEPWILPHWYDSVRFCRWLTTQAGLGEEDQAYPNPEMLDESQYPPDPNPAARGMPRDWPVDLQRHGFRLLTEAEWEVACRAGTGMSWSFGGDVRLLDRYGWFEDNSGERTHAVRVQRPNLRGLFDMHGNVYEWCHDWYGQTPEDSARQDPKGPARSPLFGRVRRGHSWDNTAWSCRSSKRNNVLPTSRSVDMGFRLALSLSSSSASQTPVAQEQRSGDEGN